MQAGSSVNGIANTRGFTPLVAITAILVLAVGLLTAGIVRGKIRTTGRRSSYMTLASKLASDKLEDLTRWQPADPNVCVPAGSDSTGSLTADAVQTITCSGGATDNASYFDDVRMGATDGTFSETVQTVRGGSTVYVTTRHSADGSIAINTSATPPSAPATFHRRWMIEGSSRLGSVHRITVLVTLLDPAVQPAVRFEMSATGNR